MARRPAPPKSRPPVSRQAASLAAIRMLILLVVLMMGGVGWYVSGREDATRLGPAALRSFGWVVTGAWIIAVGGVTAVRMAWGRATDAGSRRRLTVVGWALGETPALAGAAYLWTTGDPRRFAAGLFFLLLTFYLFSSPLERR